MKRAKVVLAFILTLLLICLFCSCEAIREAALRVNEKPASDAPKSQTPGAANDYEVMALDDEEMAGVFALLGLEGCDSEELGTLEFLTVNLEADKYFVNLTYRVDKPYEEVEAALMDHMKGDWETDGDGAVIMIIKDDFTVTCSLDKNNKEIWFAYMAESEVPFIKEVLADHWPPVLKMPEELSGQPDSSLFSLMPEEGFATYTREWELKDDEEANRIFGWFGDNLKGNEIICSDITDKYKNVLYSIQGVDAWISCEKDTFSISCDTAR